MGCLLILVGCQASSTAWRPAVGADCRTEWVKRQGDCDLDRRPELCRIQNRLAPVAGGAALEIHVLNRDDLAAYGWPGGWVYVTRGLVQRVDEPALAAAVAHELGHMRNDADAGSDSRRCLRGGNQAAERAADAAGVAILRSAGYPPAAMRLLLTTLLQDPTVADATRGRIRDRLASLGG